MCSRDRPDHLHNKRSRALALSTKSLKEFRDMHRKENTKIVLFLKLNFYSKSSEKSLTFNSWFMILERKISKSGGHGNNGYIGTQGGNTI